MARVQHMVLLRFRADTAENAIRDCFAALAQLPQVIPGLEYFAGGPYASPEGLNKGFTHGFLMTFTSAADRDNYLPHPEHEKVKDLLLQYVEDVTAFDFVQGTS